MKEIIEQALIKFGLNKTISQEEKKEVMDVIYGLIFLRDDINKFIL